MKLFRDHSKKTFKFNIRQLLDPRNHSRREQRMIERSKNRVDDKYTLYLNGTTETQLQYEDYYETDLELEDKVKEASKIEQYKSEVLSDHSMKVKNINFVENVTASNDNDCSSILQ